MRDGGEASIIVVGLLAFNSKRVGGNMRRVGEGKSITDRSIVRRTKCLEGLRGTSNRLVSVHRSFY